jgi:hypothetical protein
MPRTAKKTKAQKEEPIVLRPLSDHEKLMQEKFSESIVNQSDLVDRLSVQLFTLELAVPGLFATVVKLIGGDKTIVVMNAAFFITFGCWIVALLLTLIAVIPRDWNVNPSILKQDPEKMSEGLGVEDFFRKSAEYKRWLVIASCVLFFAGIVSAIFTAMGKLP